MLLVKFVRVLQVVVEADDIECFRHSLFIGAVDGCGNHARGVEFVTSTDHGRGYLRALLRLCVLQHPLLVADRPENNGRRVAIALDHGFELRQAFGAGTHLSRFAHHHHAHAVTGLDPLRCGHIVRGAHGVAAHFAQHAQPVPLQPVGHGRAHAGMVLMVTGALNLERLAVEKESLVSIENRGTHAKAPPLGIARLSARFDGHDGRVEIGLIDRP